MRSAMYFRDLRKNFENYSQKVRFVFFFQCMFVFSCACGQSYLPYTATVYDSSSTTGYYFVAPKLVNAGVSGNNDANMILNRYGELIYYRTFPYPIRATDFKLQPNGKMTYSDYGKFYIMDSTFTIIDTISPEPGLKFDGHDFQILPNGNYMYLALENITMDLSMYHFFNISTLWGDSNATVKCGVIVELDSMKNVAFRWNTKDHFAFEETDEHCHYNPSIVDWTHCNSIERDTDGNIILSSRNFNEVTKINRNDSSIIWRWGGDKNEFTFFNDPLHFRTQHDARRIANGNITLFDNGFGGQLHFHPATAKEYVLDETLKTATLVWSYVHDSSMYSESRGSVQRLANGNTVVSYGRYIESNVIFTTVKPNGSPIFELYFPDTCVSYRAFNYETLPWDLNQPKINCEQIGGQVFLSVDSGLNSYAWNTGDTTYKILVTSPGTFNVFIPRGSGGFIRSENFIVSSLTNPCNLSNVNEPVTANDNFLLSPNPVQDNLQVNLYLNGIHAVEIYDSLGRIIYSKLLENQSSWIIPVSGLNSGVYYIRVNGQGRKFIKI
jgi:hypothetical protein